jgi:cation diffusion facilitator family transporter
MNAIGESYKLPPDKDRALDRAVRLEWISVAFLGSIILLMGIVMGSSQTMKAMWLEDTLSLIPSVSFLVGAHFRRKPPDEAFPYGYRRAVLVGFMCGAVALFGFGIYILGDSVFKLVKAEHPSIPSVHIFGTHIWLGWIMMAALTYSVLPPLILGRMKLRLASELHDKTLHVSAAIDKGDWLSGLAGVAGLLGIAFGLWWADGVAAAFISIEIVSDGWENLRNSVAQLMNKRPSDIETQEKDPVLDKLQEALERLEWVEHARVRLREDGDVLTGEAFLVLRDGRNGRDLLDSLEQAQEVAHSLDWRLHDINMVPVRSVN